ncbi:unnamed protein product [Bursaphelenchus xylophilus]|uniref:(pine wood nematode) hypothetical protein n=1 Tax=Bursaphelenchus xylophilus TaxID=6326 RepID=A0A1I7RVF3_BURXY|nr:unnamed protein product [Bursaphelenchus xylophilus]CAG9086761.1 unnamed protein product [Bursaphelenchus xylophilus]
MSSKSVGSRLEFKGTTFLSRLLDLPEINWEELLPAHFFYDSDGEKFVMISGKMIDDFIFWQRYLQQEIVSKKKQVSEVNKKAREKMKTLSSYKYEDYGHIVAKYKLEVENAMFEELQKKLNMVGKEEEEVKAKELEATKMPGSGDGKGFLIMIRGKAKDLFNRKAL